MNRVRIHVIIDLRCDAVLYRTLGEHTFLILRNILIKSTFLKAKKQTKAKHPIINLIYFTLLFEFQPIICH